VFYITDENNKLLGGVTLRKLISSPPHIKVTEIMSRTTLIELSPYSDLGFVTSLFEKYDLVTAPVVNDEKKLIGTVVIDDIMDRLRKTTLTQIYGLGKIAEVDVETRYSDLTSPFALVKKRIVWLFLLVILGYLASSIIKLHAEALAAVVALSFFIPMLCDTGGNAGCQTVTTVIRSLSTGDIHPRNIWKVVKYEIISALIMGLIIGVVGFLRALLLVEGDLIVSFVVGISVCCVIIVAILTGLTMPFLAKLIGIDPAVLSAPLITTVVDIIGLIVYFKIASLFLPILGKL
jgi:magnesium transporter